MTTTQARHSHFVSGCDCFADDYNFFQKSFVRPRHKPRLFDKRDGNIFLRDRKPRSLSWEPRNHPNPSDFYDPLHKAALCFVCYLSESDGQDNGEILKVRPMKLTYHLDDESMSLTEPRTENSGYVQGRMFHRQKVPREPKTIGSEYLTWRDLRVGEDIALFGRKYRIVACNEFTKNFLQDRGISVQEVEGMPIDSWNIRNHFGRRPTGQDANVKVQEEENLRHWETMPGTMAFHVAWLDTKNDFHGARLKRTFRMLANKDDDSVTLIETTPGFNNALFLKDAQLPYMSNDGVRRYYRVANFRPGLWIEVFKRPMYIYDVEGEATRAYMTQYYGPINFGHCSIRLLEDGPPPSQMETLPDQLIFTAENPEFPRTKFLFFYHLNARRADIYEEGRLREWSKGRPFLLDIDVSHLTEKDFMPGSRITLFRWTFVLGDAHPRTSDYLKFKHAALHDE